MPTVGFLLILAFALCGAGAALGMALPDERNPKLTAWVGSLAALSALYAAALVLAGGEFHAILWTIKSIGSMGVSLDCLSAVFLLLAALVVFATSIFSAGYLKRYAGHHSLRAFNAGYLLLFASIVWILISDDVLGFLIAWESMSILSYLLVNFEHDREGTRQAGYIMLAMGEPGFIAVEIVFLFLALRAGSLQFSSLKVAGMGLGEGARWIVFLLTFFGFGVKTGLIPVNSWLPRAHPAAPANVSAILSGTILNLGLYGIVRVNFDLIPVDNAAAGLIVLAVGAGSAIVGILYATAEVDFKALLAHSSIENMGVATIGFGAALIFTAYGKPVLAGMGLLAGFYHVINHSLYKSLLFLGAGAVDERSGTRDLDKLGGLIRLMPYTAIACLAGTLAISGLPPFNGFVSEWLTLEVLLRSAEVPSIPMRLAFAVSGALLALTAALAVTCFVKAFAMGFLGVPRSSRAEKAREAHPSELAPMALLAVLCLALGVLPTYVIPALGRELFPIVPSGTVAALVPPFFATHPAHRELPPAFVADFHNLGAQVGQSFLPGRGLVLLHRGGTLNPVIFAMSPAYGSIALALLVLMAWFVTTRSTRKRNIARSELWAGGISQLLPEMTYTATGFSNPVRVVFQAIFRPRTVEDLRETVAIHFRTAIRRRSNNTYLVDRVFFDPLVKNVNWIAALLARMHHGRLNAYVMYAFGFLLVILLLFWIS